MQGGGASANEQVHLVLGAKCTPRRKVATAALELHRCAVASWREIQKEKSHMKLPKQMTAVQRQVNTLPTATAVEPAFLGDLIGGLFDLGALVCQAFSGKDREDCLRGYNMVAGPARKTLGGLGDLLL